MSTQVTTENFAQEVEQAEIPVLIDFYADWCMPCKMMAPVMEEIATEAPEVKVCKVNIDQQPELAEKFQVMSIPTLMLMKEGKPLATSIGVQPKQTILDMLNQET